MALSNRDRSQSQGARRRLDAGERVVIASTDFIRIREYQSQVEGHADDAVVIQSSACGSPGGIEVVSGAYWVC